MNEENAFTFMERERTQFEMNLSERWNEQFQSALDMAETTFEQKLEKYARITALNRDFVTQATNLAELIISEYFLPEDKKTLRVKTLGGIAGGDKFVCHGILFKLAKGSKGPYRNDDENAAKAMGNDLRGANQLFGCEEAGLSFALQAIVDYKGFRLHCQAWLPIGKDTLVLGTSDGGKDIKNEDEELEEKMRNVANVCLFFSLASLAS